MSDLAILDELTVESILSHLKERYDGDQIYTYVGDILIAINPYQTLPLYSSKMVDSTVLAHLDVILNEVVLGETQGLSEYRYNAYEAMLRTKSNQAFVISGESGGGKTESTKFLVNHVIELCKASNKELEDRITQLNPLIEAFGNAKTVMNDNSSRFGKFLELKFDRTGAVTGAEISEYLLEKSRVTEQSPGEQNYHIFYILLTGLTDQLRASLRLGKPSEHAYVAIEGGPSDAELLQPENAGAFPALLATFSKMGFSSDDVDSMQNVLAALLHLGNVQFSSDKDDFAEVVGDRSSLTTIAELLKVDLAGLEESLTSMTVAAGGEFMTKKFTAEAARETRDTLARGLYSRMFGWLITCCNSNLAADGGKASQAEITLGILDIFGFENFATNRLEQLCINITNEQLQFFFSEFIFAMEQKEYAEQGIDVSRIEFVDNQPTLDMLLSKPRGVLATLDEESRFPKATDVTFTNKVSAQLATHASESFKPPPSNRDMHFSVRHYAGMVKYSTDGFLTKNRDALSQPVVNTMKFSEDPLIGSLWKARKTGTGTFRTMRGDRVTVKRKAPTTVGSQFVNSLEDLMRRIQESTPHFIRCLKPNAQKKPSCWNESLVEKQLMYAGVLETVRIRKMGYSVREVFSEFVNRYAPIAFAGGSNPDPSRETCEKIMAAVGVTDFVFGKEKVFMKYFHPEQLTAALRKQREAQTFVKRACRGLICRVRYRHLLKQKAAQTALVQTVLGVVEEGWVGTRQTMIKLIELDEVAAAQKLKWLKTIQRKKEKAEKERLKKEKEAEKKRVEEEAKRAKEEAKEEAKQAKEEAKKARDKYKTTKTRGKMVNGNQVFVRNEQLTMRVGKLEDHWEKKTDAKTGRFYFKNHKTRETSWIDPRTAQIRKTDARECDDEELPYGWDEAEVNGESYYIDHITQKTHWVHPKLLLDEMRQDYVGKEAGVQVRANVVRAKIKQHREKRKRLEDLKAEASEADLLSIEQRIEAMDVIIERELGNLKDITSENKDLRADIRDLNNAFGKAAFVEEHGGDGSAFAVGDVLDLYAIDQTAQQSLPQRLDTLTRDQLRALTSGGPS